MNTSEPANASTTTPPPRRRPLFLAGVILFVLGPVIYFVQILARQLWTPWYLPALASLGVLLMVLSVRQRRGILRIAGLVCFVALCGLEWYALLVATKTPAYTGPAQVGRNLPAFTAARADGRAFSNNDLASGTRSVLVFFRGRW